ncbi:unnamed protein product [Spirodela intermedia]|uniref:Uncharacterized protein n=1 Tax=Spirodela intermedia TaxID=51605 RepID=A0A7I8KNI1_SPIIN|nr:unnamed protein product [Spirodela intermedia]
MASGDSSRGGRRRERTESATFPIDAVKTRLLLRPGLPPAVLRHFVYTPLRIVPPVLFRMIAASPADLVKVRMQADGSLWSQGLKPRYAGVTDALQKIVQAEGVRGLWRGFVPNAQRAFFVNMGELACYDQAKRFVIANQACGDGVYAHTLASFASGLSATALSCPADDVIKTRMMNQEGAESRAPFESVGPLWKGFLPTWARLGPWQFIKKTAVAAATGAEYATAIQVRVSYERLRRAAGLLSF